MIKAIVRVFPEGDPILLFPSEEADHQGNILSYQFVGQHGAASSKLITELGYATSDEAQDLIDHYQDHYNCKLELID